MYIQRRTETKLTVIGLDILKETRDIWRVVTGALVVKNSWVFVGPRSIVLLVRSDCFDVVAGRLR